MGLAPSAPHRKAPRAARLPNTSRVRILRCSTSIGARQHSLRVPIRPAPTSIRSRRRAVCARLRPGRADPSEQHHRLVADGPSPDAGDSGIEGRPVKARVPAYGLGAFAMPDLGQACAAPGCRAPAAARVVFLVAGEVIWLDCCEACAAIASDDLTLQLEADPLPAINPTGPREHCARARARAARAEREAAGMCARAPLLPRAW